MFLFWLKISTREKKKEKCMILESFIDQDNFFTELIEKMKVIFRLKGLCSHRIRTCINNCVEYCEFFFFQNLSHDTRRFRFALPTTEHILGLPVGKYQNPLLFLSKQDVSSHGSNFKKFRVKMKNMSQSYSYKVWAGYFFFHFAYLYTLQFSIMHLLLILHILSFYFSFSSWLGFEGMKPFNSEFSVLIIFCTCWILLTEKQYLVIFFPIHESVFCVQFTNCKSAVVVVVFSYSLHNEENLGCVDFWRPFQAKFLSMYLWTLIWLKFFLTFSKLVGAHSNINITSMNTFCLL